MRIETERLILRTPTPSDVDLLADERNTPFVMRYNLYGISTADDIRAEIEAYDTVVMVLKATGMPIGCIYVKNDDFRYHVNSKEISRWLTVENSAKGIMSEVGPAIIGHLFRNENIDRLTARIFAPNIASIKLVEKLGFKKEGYLCEAVKNSKGQVFDLALYSLSRAEYLAGE